MSIPLRSYAERPAARTLHNLLIGGSKERHIWVGEGEGMHTTKTLRLGSGGAYHRARQPRPLPSGPVCNEGVGLEQCAMTGSPPLAVVTRAGC
jgi:hypothetical protein